MMFVDNYFSPFQCSSAHCSEQALVSLPTPLLMDIMLMVPTNESCVNTGAHVAGPQCGKLPNGNEHCQLANRIPGLPC